ncbi:SET domain-containing protein [Mycena kentingensis (nom. inval.)]|nr:SET domain-containing protein [Mycena kentingensis (nom. inval.)]
MSAVWGALRGLGAGEGCSGPNPHFSLPVVNAWEEWCAWPWPPDALPLLSHLSLELTFGARTLPAEEIARIGDTVLGLLRSCWPALRVCGLRIDQRESAPSVVKLADYFSGAGETRVLLYRNREPFQIREANSPSENRFWSALEKAAKELLVDPTGA